MAVQIVVSWLLIIPYLVVLPEIGWAILALFVGALGALVVLRASYRPAAMALTLSQLVAAAATVRALDVGLTEWTFALVVATAMVTLGTRWAVSGALAATVFLVARAGVAAPWADATVLSGLAITWAMVFITWLGLRPLEQTLGWAMTSHEDARARALEAERHRGELGRNVKSLHETHERLERLTVELDRARQAAEHARTLKARFAAYISHELRTPLNLIIGFSEMMVMAPHTYGEEVLPAAYRGDVIAIYQSARHLSTLINDVLDLSQIDAHRMALDRDDVAIHEVIAEAIGTVEAAYAENGLWIKARVQDQLPLLYIDRTRVRQVLINLLGNALRFTQQGGVSVGASLNGSDVVVAVTDTGIGIPPDELPRLFDDFRQVERPDDDRDDGSGLGLAIARRFVGMHGGWMRAESQPGHGTTMSFGLPADHAFLFSPNGNSGDSSDRSSPAPPSLPVVAVLGDDPWLLRISQRYLDGYRVLTVPGGTKLADRQWHREGVVALIVTAPTDSMSWDHLWSLTRATGTVPVICCSLRGGREAISRLGVADYVDKPVTRERLAQVLDCWRPGRGSRTILVVDDDHEMVRLLSRMIHSVSRRYRVVKAYGGELALALMRDRRPDLVLLDLLMPGVDGYGVLQQMRQDEALREIPVVVVTAKGLEDDAIVSGMFGLTRTGGFPAGELMRCLQATLDNLNAPAGAAPATAPEAAPPG
ncbi:MAG TPA: ATP-binding protein [Chloroflexota bacterium]|nr:ATP-binding protein [Chloroflexota bacterium]